MTDDEILERQAYRLMLALEMRDRMSQHPAWTRALTAMRETMGKVQVAIDAEKEKRRVEAT